MQRRFQMVDVFSGEPFAGNPLAVVVDADGLSTEHMQQVTRWLNLSESAFLLPPTTAEADYRVRIFTLARELAFAGHPTLGACHAWLQAGGTPRSRDVIVQECPSGLVSVRPDGAGYALAAPPLLRSGPIDAATLSRMARVLGIDLGEVVDAQWADNGPGWAALLLEDAEAVLSVDADFGLSTGDDTMEVGLVGFHPEGSPFAYEVRALFTDEGGHLREDPVTGSLNASVAQWLVATGRVSPPYLVSQGTRLGRVGRPRITADDHAGIWVAGDTATYVEGHIDL